MFPDNFYPYGAILSTAILAFILMLLLNKLPNLRIFSWQCVLAILLAGNVLDYLSTWLFVSAQGIDAEGNDIARALMRLGWMWFTVFKLIILNALSVLWVLTVMRYAPILRVVPLALGIMLVATAAHNVFSYLRF